MTSEFAQNVYEITRKIPRGNVMTYGQIARLIGRVGAGQAIGRVLAANTDPKIPCHRVCCSDGKISGYFGSSSDTAIKHRIKKLEKEGVVIRNGKIVNMGNILFNGSDQNVLSKDQLIEQEQEEEG
jgi:O-6-methylguanine DNA methyltransferase